MTAPTRPVVRYHGGKWRLAPWIITHFPRHRVYVEPFGGGASVLMRKPRSYAEVYNDLDGDVVNLFRVLRSPRMALELERAVRLTPFAREEFDLSYRPVRSRVERARRLMFRSFAGFGSSVTRPNRDGSPQRTGFRANVTRSGTIPATDWAGLADQIPLFAERMAAVVIEQMPALRLIAKYDSTDALLYVDPPYLHSTREPAAGGSYRGYRFEMSDEDHRALILALRGARGMVVVSGHPSRLYDELLDGWQRVEKEHHADGARPRTEVLWINFACSAALSRENAQPSLALEARS